MVVHVARELAENASVEFASAVLRPHAFMMGTGSDLTGEGKSVLDAAHKAGLELAGDGAMAEATLEAVSRPLISEDELRQMFNRER